MRARLALVLVLPACVAAACSSFTGDDPAPVEPGADGGSPTRSAFA